MTFVRKYRKGLVSLAGVAISWGVLVLLSPSGPITGAEVAAGLVSLGGVIGVTAVPNTP